MENNDEGKQHDYLNQVYEHQIRKETTEWSYAHWEDSACGTPRDNYGTLWITCNHSNSIAKDLESFFDLAKEKLGHIQIQSNPSIWPCEKVGRGNRVASVCIMKDDVPVLHGFTHGEHTQDTNVGRYAILHATNETGCEMIIQICMWSSFGYMTYLFHDMVERDLGNKMRLVVSTGFGPTIAKNEEPLISTLLTLTVDSTDVARCLLTYIDASNIPSVGPTIEKISVRESYRGQGYLPVLWFWVRRFIEDNFRIESLNSSAPEGHVMLKATNTCNTEIDVHLRRTITDRDFFHDMAGFSVRKQASLDGSEAVLFIPLLKPNEIQDRAEQRGLGEEDVSTMRDWPQEKGARICANCHQLGTSLLRCTRCGDVHYCCKACQKQHWKQHKLWCGNSRAELGIVLGKQEQKEGTLLAQRDENVNGIDRLIS